MNESIPSVTLTKQKDKSIVAFPSVGILNDNTNRANGLVVLFTAHDTGSVLRNGTNIIYSVGYYMSHWCTEDFECYNGKVTLQNV